MSIAEKLITVAENEQIITDSVNEVKRVLSDWQVECDDTPVTLLSDKVETLAQKCNDEGYEYGLADGKQAEYDRFWDNFQIDNNGNPRADYSYAFYTAAGVGWNVDNFKPKYDLKPTLASNMFYQFSSGKPASLVEILEQAGVTLDTSNCTACNRMFYQSPVTDIPHLDLTKCTNVQYLCCNCYYLKSIEITMAENTASTYDRMIYGCHELENLTIHGKLDKSLDLKSCTKLTRASIDSVLSALSITVTSVQTLTLSATAVNNAYTTEEWEVLVGVFGGLWTIVLA